MADLVLARARITEAAERCLAAAGLAARQAVFDQRMSADWTPRRAALAAAHPAVASRLPQIEQALTRARDLAAAHDFAAADAALDAALQALDDATALKAASERIDLRLRALKADVTALSHATPRSTTPHIGPELALLDTAVAQAESGATRFAIDATNAEIDAATTSCHRLKARQLAFTSSDTAAVKSQMATLCQQPGGDRLLDQLINTLPASPTARKHILSAMEVRFGLKGGAQDEGVGADAAKTLELRRIYKVMASVPDKHTKDNPSLKRVTRKPSGSGSAYDSTLGQITLGDGPNALRVPRTLAEAAQLPAIEEDCKPLPGAAPVFFDWNAQHELGHALDDKKKFMASRAGNSTFGGWMDHGGNVMVVAEAAAAEFALPGIDKKMIALYLDAGTEPAVPPAGWDRVKDWADKARVAAEPWNKGADCSAQAAAGGLKLGTRVYHESYGDHWVSYDAAARAQGLTGYQFRSAGEWFSELYAGYKMQVLKPGHPANLWLNKLFGVATTP